MRGLLHKVMKHDEHALALLYEQLSGQVYSLALFITKTEAAAEEVLQDVFWQVWRQAPRYDAHRGSVIAWVLTITRTRALVAARTYKRALAVISASPREDFADTFPSSDLSPLDLLDVAQQESQLEAALLTLDPIKRQLISLAFFRGLTHDEIAAQSGLPVGTVKSHVKRGMATLKLALTKGTARQDP